MHFVRDMLIKAVHNHQNNPPADVVMCIHNQAATDDAEEMQAKAEEDAREHENSKRYVAPRAASVFRSASRERVERGSARTEHRPYF